MTPSSTTSEVVTIGQRRRVLAARLGWARWLRARTEFGPVPFPFATANAMALRSESSMPMGVVVVIGCPWSSKWFSK